MSENVEKSLAERFNKRGLSKGARSGKTGAKSKDKGAGGSQAQGTALRAPSYGGRFGIFVGYLVWNIVTFIGLGLTIFLNHMFMLKTEYNTRVLNGLKDSNNLLEVSGIGGDGSLVLTEGGMVAPGTYSQVVDVVGSIGKSFYAPETNLLFTPIDPGSFFAITWQFLTIPVLFALLFIGEVFYIKRMSLISGSYKENVKQGLHPGYRWLRRFNIVLAIIMLLQVIVIIAR